MGDPEEFVGASSLGKEVEIRPVRGIRASWILANTALRPIATGSSGIASLGESTRVPGILARLRRRLSLS